MRGRIVAEEPVGNAEEPEEVLPDDVDVPAQSEDEVTVWAPEPTGADEVLTLIGE